jgi:hypothetical protein
MRSSSCFLGILPRRERKLTNSALRSWACWRLLFGRVDVFLVAGDVLSAVGELLGVGDGGKAGLFQQHGVVFGALLPRGPQA